jgi:hypothetical protein
VSGPVGYRTLQGLLGPRSEQHALANFLARKAVSSAGTPNDSIGRVVVENTLNCVASLLGCGAVVVASYLYRKAKPTAAVKIAAVKAVEANVKNVL